MKSSIAIFSALLAAIIAFPCINANPVDSRTLWSETFGAVYAMTNSPTGNFILTSTIGEDGKLRLRDAVFTKGKGSFQTGTDSDPLLSQGSLQVSGDRLYAVNPGSNTISTFSINTRNPAELSLVGEPVSSGGEFPISLAVSPRTGQVCVLNGGKINGINCYKPDSKRGLVEIPGTNRLLYLNITTPPDSIYGTASQVLFSKDGSTVYASLKGIPGVQPGFLAAWSVDPYTGALSHNFVKSETSLQGTGAFGMVLIPGTDSIFVTNPAAGGYAIFDYKTPTSVATVTDVDVPGQEAICWIQRSSKIGNFYLVDLGTGIVSEVKVDKKLQGSVVRQYSQGANSGLNEAQIGTVCGKDYLYLLAAGVNSIYVLSLEGPGNAKDIQYLDLTPLARRDVVIDHRFLQGIAVYSP